MKGSRPIEARKPDAGPPRSEIAQPVEGTYRYFRGSPCALSCSFCVIGQLKRHRRGWNGSLGKIARAVGLGLWSRRARQRRCREILADLETVLAQAKDDERIDVIADDILEFDGLEQMLAAFDRYGKRCHLVSPGLRLADPVFAEALSRHDVCVTITYLAHTPAIYLLMTGNARAQSLIQQGLANLLRFQIDFNVNCVLTRENCPDLVNTARYLLLEVGLDHFTIPYFYLEQGMLDVDPRAYERFARYPVLSEKLGAIEAICDAYDKVVQLVDIPPCLVDSELRRTGRIKFGFAHPPGFVASSPTPVYEHQPCETCCLSARCSRASIYYKRYIDPLLTYLPLPDSAATDFT